MTDFNEYDEAPEQDAPQEQMSASRAARKEAQALADTLASQLGDVRATITGRHFGADEDGKRAALAAAVEAAKAVADTAASLVDATERALAAK